MSDELRLPPELIDGLDPLFGDKREPDVHPVRPHDRHLPPKVVEEDPSQPKLAGDVIDWTPYDPVPQERIVPVKPHLRRNPRRRPQGEPMTPTQVEDLSPHAHARSTDPETSHRAMENFVSSGKLRGYQVWVLTMFRDREKDLGSTRLTHGTIDHDLYRIALNSGRRFTEQGLRMARKALVERGLLEPTGETRPSPTGQEARSFRLTEAGRRFELPGRS